jgi:hypothetical protein
MEGISELGDSTPEMNFGKWRPDSARSLQEKDRGQEIEL